MALRGLPNHPSIHECQTIVSGVNRTIGTLILGESDATRGLDDTEIVGPPNKTEATATRPLPLRAKRTSHMLGHAVAREVASADRVQFWLLKVWLKLDLWLVPWVHSSPYSIARSRIHTAARQARTSP